ncbi:MAG: efflux transporter outer membrane subunit [Rickettsiales bacterium]
MQIRISLITILFILSSCVGPEYKKPEMEVAPQYKEYKEETSNISWKEVSPSADIDRGQWWKIFNDSILNDLIDSLNKNNYSLASSAALYQQSLAVVDNARASYFPNIGATMGSTSQKTNEQSTPTKKVEKDTSNHALTLTSSWELDIWGATKYEVASDAAAASANRAELASSKLSLQSSLAQYYFEIRAIDKDQELLDGIVSDNIKIVNYTKHKYKAGTADYSSLLAAENSLYNAKAIAANNKINRDQYSHAIAVLVGQSPSIFNLKAIKNYKTHAVNMPISVPSQLLERRPDIAQAEQLIIQQNAQIGVAKTAFFPVTSLNASFAAQGNNMGNLLQMPTFTWSLGPQMALGLLDGGSRLAQVKIAKKGYESAVASYKQTILSAFSEVEDQLAAINSLKVQILALKQSANNNHKMLSIAQNQYKAGIVDYSSVLNSQINYNNAMKTLVDTLSLQRSSEITLIKALGGGWHDKLEN